MLRSSRLTALERASAPASSVETIELGILQLESFSVAVVMCM